MDVRTAAKIEAALAILSKLGAVLIAPFIILTVLFCWPMLFCSWLADQLYPPDGFRTCWENMRMKDAGPLYNALWLIGVGVLIAFCMIRGGYV
jgi:hypothetical protein